MVVQNSFKNHRLHSLLKAVSQSQTHSTTPISSTCKTSFVSASLIKTTNLQFSAIVIRLAKFWKLGKSKQSFHTASSIQLNNFLRFVIASKNTEAPFDIGMENYCVIRREGILGRKKRTMK